MSRLFLSRNIEDGNGRAGGDGAAGQGEAPDRPGGEQRPGGESKRLVVEPLWLQFTSECQRF
eukprot:COSAG01_NODE_2061_length_8482_cov_6.301925_12_plen_62_part_00